MERDKSRYIYVSHCHAIRYSNNLPQIHLYDIRYDPSLRFSSSLWHSQHNVALPDKKQRAKRLQAASSKVTVHELLHLLGLDHCIYFACLMNGSGSLEEDHRQPHHLCPVCLKKLHLLVGLKEESRYRQLAEVYSDLGLEEEASFCKDQASRLDGSRRT